MERDAQMTHKGLIKKGRWYTVGPNGEHIERPEGWDPSQMTEEEISEIEMATGIPMTSDRPMDLGPKVSWSKQELRSDAHAQMYMLRQWRIALRDIEGLQKVVAEMVGKVSELATGFVDCEKRLRRLEALLQEEDEPT